jgi:transmembrane sensor
MEKMQAKELLQKYVSGLCTEEEKALIENWYLNLPDEGNAPGHDQIISHKSETWTALAARMKRPSRFTATNYTALAAAILICLSAAVYLVKVPLKPEQSIGGHAPNDAEPGANRAVLILANGKRIDLGQRADDQIVQQPGLSVIKTADGELTYIVTEPGSSGPPAIHSIVTPRGGQYHILLPDGTGVWLNSASVLKFPPVFGGAERKVELSGEAYFEVARDSTRPFKVSTADQEVTVLGTHFNINSYTDEPLSTTTLFEGLVRVSPAGSNKYKLLKPGQQSALRDGVIAVRTADMEEVLAWKNGLFIFHDEKLESILRKVSRWYNVDVAYTDEEAKKKVFGGSVSRFGKVSEILRMLEITGNVRFKIEEHQIIVMNK